jgi:tRNA (guanosine-2'-O-)-methyltransferase
MKGPPPPAGDFSFPAGPYRTFAARTRPHMTDQELYERLAAFVSDNKRALFDRLAPLRTRHVTVVLEDIYQPHNASAVVNPDVTLGSSKWVDMHRYRGEADNTKRCIDTLRAKGYSIVVTSPHAPEITPHSIPLDRPMAFCFGTELTGASDELMQAADMHLRIPMYGFTESYNISVSAAIVLFTVMERLRASDVKWQLDEAALAALKLQWARKVVHSAAHLEERFRKGEG